MSAAVAERNQLTSSWMRAVLEDYYAAKEVWETDAEEASIGYKTELAMWEKDHPRPRLADFMRAHSRAEENHRNKATIQARWETFAVDNPRALRRLEQLAGAWVAAGRRGISTKCLFEVLRYESALSTTSKPWKLDNTLTSRAARWLVEVHPEWAEHIETRALRSG